MLLLRKNLCLLLTFALVMDSASAVDIQNDTSTSTPVHQEPRASTEPAVENNYYGELLSDAWLEGADIFRMLWHDCSMKVLEARMENDDTKQYFPVVIRCLKRKTLRALDRSLNGDVLPLAEGVNLVRYDMVDREGNLIQAPHNITSNSTWSEDNLENTDWGTLALQRFGKVLRTHVIKLDVDGPDNTITTPERTEFRHRRRHHMMTMMMFGILSMGMVLVPMGFQFLAVLGGKALLLAKMALILSSIQGLKKVDDWNQIEYQKGKVAASPVNYGFYHSLPPYDHYEKRSYGSGDWPKSGSVTPPHPRLEPSAPHHDPHDRYEHIKYKFDTEARTWKPEIPKALKRSLYSLLEPKVYPVYPSSNGHEASHKTPHYDTSSSATQFSPSFGQLVTPIGPTTAITGVGPTEVHAEYTIDLPVNKIHFQSAPVVV